MRVLAVRPDGTQEGHKLEIWEFLGPLIPTGADKEDPGEKRNEQCVSFSSAKQLCRNASCNGFGKYDLAHLTDAKQTCHCDNNNIAAEYGERSVLMYNEDHAADTAAGHDIHYQTGVVQV